MARFKSILKRLFFLPPLPTLLISIPSFTLVFIVLGNGTRGLLAYLSYVFSAYALSEELIRIQEKYRAKKPEADKLAQLRRLDNSVTKPGTIVSLLIGIVSCLVMGAGMRLIMAFENMMPLGIVVGMAGIVSAYPAYCRITKKQRERLAPEILRLSDELMK